METHCKLVLLPGIPCQSSFQMTVESNNYYATTIATDYFSYWLAENTSANFWTNEKPNQKQQLYTQFFPLFDQRARKL